MATIPSECYSPEKPDANCNDSTARTASLLFTLASANNGNCRNGTNKSLNSFSFFVEAMPLLETFWLFTLANGNEFVCVNLVCDVYVGAIGCRVGHFEIIIVRRMSTRRRCHCSHVVDPIAILVSGKFHCMCMVIWIWYIKRATATSRFVAGTVAQTCVVEEFRS